MSMLLYFKVSHFKAYYLADRKLLTGRGGMFFSVDWKRRVAR